MGPQVCLRNPLKPDPHDRRHDQMLFVCLLLKDVFTVPLEHSCCTALHISHV